MLVAKPDSLSVFMYSICAAGFIILKTNKQSFLIVGVHLLSEILLNAAPLRFLSMETKGLNHEKEA
uniref:Uncharacterized protein n=1 Tax=Echeneis naucrates TaxID=173247 RepID=A0A665WW02_ECHNA